MYNKETTSKKMAALLLGSCLPIIPLSALVLKKISKQSQKPKPTSKKVRFGGESMTFYPQPVSLSSGSKNKKPFDVQKFVHHKLNNVKQSDYATKRWTSYIAPPERKHVNFKDENTDADRFLDTQIQSTLYERSLNTVEEKLGRMRNDVVPPNSNQWTSHDKWGKLGPYQVDPKTNKHFAFLKKTNRMDTDKIVWYNQLPEIEAQANAVHGKYKQLSQNNVRNQEQVYTQQNASAYNQSSQYLFDMKTLKDQLETNRGVEETSLNEQPNVQDDVGRLDFDLNTFTDQIRSDRHLKDSYDDLPRIPESMSVAGRVDLDSAPLAEQMDTNREFSAREQAKVFPDAHFVDINMFSERNDYDRSVNLDGYASNTNVMYVEPPSESGEVIARETFRGNPLREPNFVADLGGLTDMHEAGTPTRKHKLVFQPPTNYSNETFSAKNNQVPFAERKDRTTELNRSIPLDISVSDRLDSQRSTTYDDDMVEP